MIEIVLNKVVKNYGFKNILNNISFDIKTGERVALIGTNGCGKTTILKIIAGIENINSGMVTIRKNSTIGFLNQINNQEESDVTVKDIIYRGLNNIIEMKNKLDEYEQRLSNASGQELNKVINSYTSLQEKFINIGGYEIDTKVNKIINVFKINDMLERNYNTLSGGEKTIVSLASLLLKEPDILLLDEPTNHLDIDAIEWLEQFLNNYKGTVLIVSHDRYFLDKTTTKTLLIEREDIEIFNGNYSYYLEENEKRIMLEFKDFKTQAKQIEAMKQAIKRLREWGKIGENEKFFKRAACIEKRLERLEILDKPIEKKNIPISFELSSRSGNDVIKIKNLNLSFDDKIIFDKASMELSYGERVCIMGKNGSGKTTLIKAILDNNNESIKIGSNVSIVYVPQEIIFEDENITIIDEARKYFEGPESYLRASLFKFLFTGENIFKRLSALSGGERTRLKLFCLMQKENNLLILDEPTNHIDIDTKEILENALNEYAGTILFISHDRYFINKLANRIIYIEDRRLVSYIGNYNDFKDSKTN
jgi:ATPase subunit of ABC transporter with duplicated ATPase domains